MIKNVVTVTLEDQEADSFWSRFIAPLKNKKIDRDGMDQTDRKQQDQIEAIQQNQFFMVLMLMINTAASIAQILECWRVWRGFK